MKNLDLNNYGVQEMNAEEMRVTEGGFVGKVVKFLVEAIVAGVVYDVAKEAYNGETYQAALTGGHLKSPLR